MFRSIRVFLAALSVSFGLMSILAGAQKPGASEGSAYVRINAPLAQGLVDKAMAKHSDIEKLGIHAVPPGETENVIIACSIRSKNGKKSSAADLEKLARAKPTAARIDTQEIFDLLLPITDAHGGDLSGGFVVMEVPFSKANNEGDALKIGIAVRNELQDEIPNREALYRP